LVGFPSGDENAWRIGKSEKLRGRCLSVLQSIWHWREAQAERLDTPPFKVCNNSLLLRMAANAEENNDANAIVASVNLGRRHPRLAPSLTKAVATGLETDPTTLP
ncbi:MAG: HRDC domain-containing protein, partial [Verrucomicrobiia bacterium]